MSIYQISVFSTTVWSLVIAFHRTPFPPLLCSFTFTLFRSRFTNLLVKDHTEKRLFFTRALISLVVCQLLARTSTDDWRVYRRKLWWNENQCIHSSGAKSRCVSADGPCNTAYVRQFKIIKVKPTSYFAPKKCNHTFGNGELLSRKRLAQSAVDFKIYSKNSG